jgi:hypothetical protein
MYSSGMVTHGNNLDINDCVQSPSSKPCIIMRANTATDIGTKILQWYGVPDGWLLVVRTHDKGVSKGSKGDVHQAIDRKVAYDSEWRWMEVRRSAVARFPGGCGPLLLIQVYACPTARRTRTTGTTS